MKYQKKMKKNLKHESYINVKIQLIFFFLLCNGPVSALSKRWSGIRTRCIITSVAHLRAERLQLTVLLPTFQLFLRARLFYFLPSHPQTNSFRSNRSKLPKARKARRSREQQLMREGVFFIRLRLRARFDCPVRRRSSSSR